MDICSTTGSSTTTPLDGGTIGMHPLKSDAPLKRTMLRDSLLGMAAAATAAPAAAAAGRMVAEHL